MEIKEKNTTVDVGVRVFIRCVNKQTLPPSTFQNIETPSATLNTEPSFVFFFSWAHDVDECHIISLSPLGQCIELGSPLPKDARLEGLEGEEKIPLT